MRSIRIGLLAAMLLLAACKTSLPTQKPNTPRSGSPSAKASLQPSPNASVAASPAASPQASPPVERPMLLSASETSFKISGQLQIDASYALSLGGGRLISDKGASAIAMADASLISDAGGNLIANNGGGLISDRGGSLVGNNSSNLVSKVKYGVLAGFGLLQTAATVAMGVQLPAAGMVVGVLSLSDGQAMPIGVDVDGKPAYAVYSDAAGGYGFYLPKALQGNVRIVARPPAKADNAAVDARMAFDALTRPKPETPVNMDEDTTQATLNIRSAVRGRMVSILSAEDVQTAVDDIVTKKSFPVVLKGAVLEFSTQFNTESKIVGLNKAPVAIQSEYAQRIVDIALRQIDLEKLIINAETSPTWTDPPTATIPVLIDGTKRIRAGADAAIAADPQFFEKQAYLREVNQARPAADAYVIKKGSDLAVLLVNEFFSRGNSANREVEAIFETIGLTELHTHPSGATGNLQLDRLSSATVTVGNALVLALLTNENKCRDEAMALIRSYKPVAP